MKPIGGLADLKGNFLTEDDIATMRGLLAGDMLDPNTRAHMLYALGQGLERAKVRRKLCRI